MGLSTYPVVGLWGCMTSAAATGTVRCSLLSTLRSTGYPGAFPLPPPSEPRCRRGPSEGMMKGFLRLLAWVAVVLVVLPKGLAASPLT